MSLAPSSGLGVNVSRKKKPGRPKGTPDKLTPAVQAAIVASVTVGTPLKWAAARAVVSERSVTYWMSRGRQEKKGPYFAFFAAVQAAKAERLEVSLDRIEQAGQGGRVIERATTTTTRRDGSSVTHTVERFTRPDWLADAWFAERAHGDDFAGNRREVKELRTQLAAVLKAVASGQLSATPEAGQTVDPKVSGDAKPDSI